MGKGANASVEEMVGQSFGTFRVVGPSDERLKGHKTWRAVCESGHELSRTTNSLRLKVGCPRCQKEKRNLVGKRFGRLSVLAQHSRPDQYGSRTFCTVKCICGKTWDVAAGSLRLGTSKSCGRIGCTYGKQRKLVDMTGKQVGGWQVLSRSSVRRDCKGRSIVHWMCRCLTCQTERVISRAVLAKKPPQCVCQRRMGPTFHPMYKQAHGIISRVKDPTSKAFKYYGARDDVKPWIHPAWDTGDRMDLANGLLKELGEKPSPLHSIDRIDVSKGYVPGNLRWADKKEQCHNRRPMISLNRNGQRISKTCRNNLEMARWILSQPEGQTVLSEAVARELLRRKRTANMGDDNSTAQPVLPTIAA